MQVSILSGIYADENPDLRTSYPRNYVPVVKKNGLSDGYMKPAEGIADAGGVVPGIGRGGINWLGTTYRVLGTKLCSIGPAGVVTVLGDVGGTGQVSLDYGFDRLAVASGGKLFYLFGGKVIQVTDANLGTVNDMKWMAGYYVTTDGNSIVVTNLQDPTTVSPFKYGSAESDPDKIMAVDELRNELYAFGRYTIEVFDNVGGDFFPFQVVQGAMVPKGVIGTYAYCSIGDTFVFCGSGRGEAPAVYMMLPGNTQKLSTREIDLTLAGYSEQQLSSAVMEVRVLGNLQLVYLHLPDRCLVYDTISSRLVGESIWFTLDSGAPAAAPATYRARNFVWCYGQWNCEDPTSAKLGTLTDAIGTHYAGAVGWEFGTQMVYNEGNDAIVLEMELACLPGRVPLGADPVVWTSHSFDGETWGPERATSAGKQGERTQHIAWRNCGRIRGNYRMQKFRGSSDAHLPVLRLEVKAEPLATRPGRG